MQEEFFDALRHIFILLWIGSFFPCILVHASNIVPEKSNVIEIRAFRLQQYEFAGKPYGSKSWKVLYEAVSLNGSTLRKCVLVSWRDLVNKELESTIGAAVGAVVVAIPEDFNALTENEKQAFQTLEQKFYNFRTDQAVFFAPNTPSLKYLMKSVSIASKKAPSAIQHLYNSVAANNFQISSSNSATSNLVTLKNYNVLGHLNAGERGKPYIFVVAYYDTHSMAPGFNSGVDSNGSGVATLLEEKALEIASLLNIDGFEASEGWLTNFKLRHGILFKSTHGEAGAINVGSLQKCQDEVLRAELSKFKPDDIFNIDETGLFWQLLPNKTLAFKGEKCAGGKKSKERVTVLVGANMTGTEKLPLLVIGKSKNPRCFKNIKVPLDYMNNQKAWMTGAIFEEWLKKWDKTLEKTGRKVLLYVHNCSAHPHLELDNITLKFFPPNTTAMSQPCDQGIIQNLKVHYRRFLLRERIKAIDDKKDILINLLGAVHNLRRAWAEVKPETIANCFRHAKFVINSEILAILSRFYSDAGNRAKYNIVFVLSTAGKFNYQGSRQWIEDFQEKHSDENVVFSLCLDGLAGGKGLNVHVSKALSQGSASHKLFQHLNTFSSKPVDVVSKKINLSADRLAWEHEVFNIRRIHALTISHFDNHLNPMRNSMLDTRESVDLDALEENVNTIANALVSFVYELDPSLCSTNQSKTGCSLLTGSSGVNRQRLVGWLDTFGSDPRSIASAHTSKVVAADLKDIVGRYADKAVLAEVNVADYVLYDVFEDKLSADIVKPAIFELFLAVLICAYLFVIYQFSLNAQSILETSIVRLKKLT